MEGGSREPQNSVSGMFHDVDSEQDAKKRVSLSFLYPMFLEDSWDSAETGTMLRNGLSFVYNFLAAP